MCDMAIEMDPSLGRLKKQSFGADCNQCMPFANIFSPAFIATGNKFSLEEWGNYNLLNRHNTGYKPC